mgnify:CR=1 FL=1
MKIQIFNKNNRNTSLRFEKISGFIFTGSGFYIIYKNKKLSKLVLFWEPEFEDNLERLHDVLLISDKEWNKLNTYIDNNNITTYSRS